MATTRGRGPQKVSELEGQSKKKKKTPAIAKLRTSRAAKPAAKVITPEERWHMISVAAYYLAEKQGFLGDDPALDWLRAEMEIDELLGKQNTVVE